MTLFLGCPVWGIKRWVGNLFPSGTAQKDYLRVYSRRFNTVEGNTTFYGMPTEETVLRWRDETPEGFRFCLKFPQTISHQGALIESADETESWLKRVALMEGRAGPSFLQLPPRYHPGQMDDLADYLAALPRNSPYAVEVRHPSWFLPNVEAALDALLTNYGIARVLFDVRGLRAADPSDPLIKTALEKKPDVPYRTTQTAPFTFVRYIADLNLPANALYLDAWAETVANWLKENVDVYFFLHCPDDFFAPVLCRDFHARVSRLAALPPLPAWAEPVAAGPQEQMSLF